MNWIAYAACLLLMIAVGYALLCVMVGATKLNASLLLGLCWTLGAGLISILLFVGSLTGRVPGRGMLAVIVAIAAIAILVAFRRGRLTTVRRRAGSSRAGWIGRALTVAGAALIAAAIGSVALESTLPGLPDTDAFAIWTLKAKIVSTLPLRPIPAFLTDPTLSFSHQDYPLGLPLLTAAVHAATGWPIETCGQSLLLPMFVALILVAYGSVRSLVSGPLALGFTAAFVAGPTLVSLAGTTEAELPLLLQHTASLSLLLLWMKRGDRGGLIAAAAAAAFAAFTKNEGLALLPILGVAAVGFACLERFTPDRLEPHLAPSPGTPGQWRVEGDFERQTAYDVRSRARPTAPELTTGEEKESGQGLTAKQNARERVARRLRDIGWAAGLALVLIAPWLIYRTHLPHTHEDYGTRLAHAAGRFHVDRLGPIASTFLTQPLRFHAVGGFWLLLPLCVAIGWRASRQSAVIVLGFVMLAHVGLYVLVFMVTPWDLGTLLPMVSPKLFMHVSPAALLLMGMYAGELQDRRMRNFPSNASTAKTPSMAEPCQ